MSQIITAPTYHHSRGCTDCPMLARCQNERLWLDTLPCEAVLDIEDFEFERDSFQTLGRMPIEARVNVEAMG